MGAFLAGISITESLILAGVFAANLVLAARSWRTAERRIERVGVVVVTIGTTALLLIASGIAGG